MKAIKSGAIDEIDPRDQLKQALDKDIISKNEYNLLTRVRQEVSEMIAVDDFPFEAFDRYQAQPEDEQTKVA